MSYRLEVEPDDYADRRGGRRRSSGNGGGGRLVTTLALVALAAGGGVFTAYHLIGHRSGPGEIPVIRASDSPVKEAPQNPGGMKVPDQNMFILNDKLGPVDSKVEQLLPSPEAPLPRPAAPPPPVPQAPVMTAQAAPPIPDAAGANAPQALPDVPGAVPTPLSRTVAAPDQQASQPLQDSMAATGKRMASAAPPRGASPLADRRVDTVEPHSVPMDDRPAAGAPRSLLPGAPSHTAPATTTATTGAMKLSPGYHVQIGSVRSVAAAQSAWSKLKLEDPAVLGRLHADAVRVDLAGRGVFYRIMVGPIANGTDAQRVCGELKRHNMGCLLVRQ